jgi:hypothetical protein
MEIQYLRAADDLIARNARDSTWRLGAGASGDPPFRALSVFSVV